MENVSLNLATELTLREINLISQRRNFSALEMHLLFDFSVINNYTRLSLKKMYPLTLCAMATAFLWFCHRDEVFRLISRLFRTILPLFPIISLAGLRLQPISQVCHAFLIVQSLNLCCCFFFFLEWSSSLSENIGVWDK